MSLAEVLNSCADDTLLAIASALDSATDLLCLAVTSQAACQRLYFTTTSYSRSGSAGASTGSAVAAQQAETWSVVEEAARRWIMKCSDQERGWVPRREIVDESLQPAGWERFLGLMREIETLRCAAMFGQSLEDWATRPPKHMGESNYNATKSCVKMRAGCHRARFSVASQPHEMLFGVVRPDWDTWKGQAAETVHFRVGHCFYHPGRENGSTHRFAQGGESAAAIFCRFDLDRDGILNREEMKAAAAALCPGESWDEALWDNICIEFEADPTYGFNPEAFARFRVAARETGDCVELLLDLDQGSMTVTVYKNDERLGVIVTSGLRGEYCWAVSLYSGTVLIGPEEEEGGSEQGSRRVAMPEIALNPFEPPPDPEPDWEWAHEIGGGADLETWMENRTLDFEAELTESGLL